MNATAILLTLAGIFLAANLFFALWMGYLWFRWQRKLPRDTEGLIPGAKPYSCGEGETAILLVHGFADLPITWQRVARRLAETHGFTVRAMRLPGMGAPYGEARRQSVDSWLFAIEEEVLALQKKHPSVWLTGHSLGGTLTLLLAARGRVKVDGVSLWAPYLKVHPEKERTLPLFKAETWYAIQRRLLLLPLSDTFFPAKRIGAGPSPFDYTAEKVIARHLFGELFSAARRAREITRWPIQAPLFVILAGNDTIVQNDAAEALLATWPGRQCWLTEPDAPHALPLAETWEQQTDRLALFIHQESTKEN